jgi:hypothetical protein
MWNICVTFDRELFFDTHFILSLDNIIFFVSFLPVISSAIFIPPYSSVGGLINGKKILETGEGFKLEAAILNTILYNQEAKF